MNATKLLAASLLLTLLTFAACGEDDDGIFRTPYSTGVATATFNGMPGYWRASTEMFKVSPEGAKDIYRIGLIQGDTERNYREQEISFYFRGAHAQLVDPYGEIEIASYVIVPTLSAGTVTGGHSICAFYGIDTTYNNFVSIDEFTEDFRVRGRFDIRAIRTSRSDCGPDTLWYTDGVFEVNALSKP